VGERKFNLGELVVDKPTGFTGKIIAIHLYLDDEINYSVQRPLKDDGSLGDTVTMAERRLERIETSAATVK
jgi:hypothetical protein